MIFFKSDANNEIGAGHLKRSFTIAAEFVKQGHEVCFLFSNTSEDYKRECGKLNFRFHQLNDDQKIDSYSSLVNRGDLIIFDSDDPRFYGGALIKNLRNSGIKTACFTITDSPVYDVDILINPNIAALEHHYKVQSYCHKLIGPQFMIFGEKFRNYSVEKTKPKNDRILLFMGNADSNGLTLHILKSIVKAGALDCPLDVLVGNLNPQKDEIEKLILGSNLPIEFHFNVKDMNDFYANFSMAISAAGMTMWELGLFQIPQLVVASSEREKVYQPVLVNYNFVDDLGFYDDVLDNDQIGTTILAWVNSSKKHLELAQFSKSVNPNGLSNLVNEIGQILVGN